MRKRRKLVGSRALAHLQTSQKIVAAVALVAAGNVTLAAIDTWVGNSTPNWNSDNWTGGNNPPLGFDSVSFGVAGTAGSVLNNDLAAGLNISGITFNAGASAFTFNGNAITLGGA